MVLPSSGIIYLSQVNTELGKAATSAISLGQADVRQMFQVPSGTISLSQGYGKGVTAGVYDQYAVGYHEITMPWYNTLYVAVYGAGAGGTGGTGRVQVNPRYSEGRNETVYDWQYNGGNNGVGGGASVFYAPTNIWGYGGGANGAQGSGAGGSYIGLGGGQGGGLGGLDWNNTSRAASGGPGGVSAINFYRGGAGAPVPYTRVGLTVGGGGGGGAGGTGGGDPGNGGAGGRVYLSWY